jgi:hypothetical protein
MKRGRRPLRFSGTQRDLQLRLHGTQAAALARSANRSRRPTAWPRLRTRNSLCQRGGRRRRRLDRWRRPNRLLPSTPGSLAPTQTFQLSYRRGRARSPSRQATSRAGARSRAKEGRARYPKRSCRPLHRSSASAGSATATGTVTGNNWSKTFSSSTFGNFEYTGKFKRADNTDLMKSGLDASDVVAFSITWVPQSLC